MEFKDILAISGQPGLYKYVAQSARGIIVESLGDGKRMSASATARVSALAEISMFTEGEDIPLADVFTRMYAHTGGKEGLSPKSSPEQMKAYFAEVLPEYDRERVHVSDIKKALSWFNILVGAGFTEFKLPDEEQVEESAEEGSLLSDKADAGIEQFDTRVFVYYLTYNYFICIYFSSPSFNLRL